MSDTIDLTIDTLTDGTFVRPEPTAEEASVVMNVVKLPNGGGGVRFASEDADKVVTTVYVTQDDWKALGMPTAIRLTVEAKA